MQRCKIAELQYNYFDYNVAITILPDVALSLFLIIYVTWHAFADALSKVSYNKFSKQWR